jgi:peroxiredoxin
MITHRKVNIFEKVFLFAPYEYVVTCNNKNLYSYLDYETKFTETEILRITAYIISRNDIFPFEFVDDARTKQSWITRMIKDRR